MTYNWTIRSRKEREDNLKNLTKIIHPMLKINKTLKKPRKWKGEGQVATGKKVIGSAYSMYRSRVRLTPWCNPLARYFQMNNKNPTIYFPSLTNFESFTNKGWNNIPWRCTSFCWHSAISAVNIARKYGIVAAKTTRCALNLKPYCLHNCL